MVEDSRHDRRLAAIMFTDIVGYTSLSQRDEALAMKLLTEHNDLLRPQFKRFGGREVKAIGDSFLVEFTNALDAVRCALAIQEALHERNQEALGRKLEIRIGIHVGDVIRGKKGDILGDAVNVSSRVEPVAEPGGICISEQTYDHVRNKLNAISFVKLKVPTLKNVSIPIDIYKVVLPWNEQKFEVNLIDRRRIAILPFTNISPDPNDEYLADGLTEELISTMSKIRELKVVSRTSTMQYKAKPKPIGEIGKELSVGTILE
ncbi:MAG: adenylate/guanylate cyclase domain-containing protein [Nitrososphaerales archaeon]